MPLTVSHVKRLDDVVEPAVEFLTQPIDLFARQRIVVPTAGAKAWLQDALARRLGTTGRGDGILANIDIAFPAAIAALLRGPARSTDPWGVEPLTFHVLEVLAQGRDFGIPFDVAREPLLSARQIAARFDRYHVRRPAMILRWEEGAPVLSPFAEGRSYDGDHAATALDPGDRWQFEVWRAVRERIGSPSPPARARAAAVPADTQLFVAGLQSLSLDELASLSRIGTVSDVRVCLVHPSPPLAHRWAAPLPTATPGVPPRQEAPELPEDLDPLVATWLHGSRETQHLLASQGILPTMPTEIAIPGSATLSLLARMQASVRSAAKPRLLSHDIAADHSLTIHRCHGLARQAEVLHDALLHAFRELPDLQPHEVAIVSPCIAEAAPHLRAVFDRGVSGLDASGARADTRLPLVVADRSIRDTSAAIDLLARLLAAVDSRCGVDDVLSVASHPLVTTHFRIDADDLEYWSLAIERTQIRWGIDTAHRGRRGFPAGIPDTHTWVHGLRRMLLGATLPDGPERPEVAGVVPLSDVDLADIDRIAALVRIMAVIGNLESAAAAPRSVAEWCRLIDDALTDLTGPDNPSLADATVEIRRLHDGATAVAVPFHDVRTLLAEQCEAISGRQPLFTGAITATSMVSLRGVPLRVIAVIGYDDDALGGFEAEGNDLVARQQLAGDGDPRIELRRSLLDAMLAARDRLVITCTGTSIKTNLPLPLVTPLAEFADFAVRHGVARIDPSRPSGVEISHPRHAIGRRNFTANGVLPRIIWSHDAAAKAASAGLGLPRTVVAHTSPPTTVAAVVELSVLEMLVRDPLRLFLETTLGINTWRADDAATPATLPLTLEAWRVRRLANELLELLASQADAAAAERAEMDWCAAILSVGRLPFGNYGQLALAEIRGVVHGILAKAAEEGVPLTGAATHDLQVEVGPSRVVGHLPGVQVASQQLVTATPGEAERQSFGRPLHKAALHLLAATAAGLDVSRVAIVSRGAGWRPGINDPKKKPAQVRVVRLADDLRDPAQAAARLGNLCELAAEALATPRPLFNGADDESAFNQFIANDFYHRSSECLVYGPTPRYEAVIPPGSAEAVFIESFERLLNPAYKGSKQGYVVS